MRFSDCRILISLPLYGGLLYYRCESSLSRLQRWCSEQGVHISKQTISNESLLPRARNMGIARVLSNKEYFTHILFLDGDMGFEPYRLGRLLQFDKEFVGCPGPAKHIHWEYAPEAMIDGKDLEHSTLRYAVNFIPRGKHEMTDGFMEVHDFGCCFCLVKTEAILKMVEWYPESKCNNMAWINGKPGDSTNDYALFDTYVDVEGRYLECDHAFMARYRDKGGKVYADMTSDLLHSGMHHFKGDMASQFFGRKHVSQGMNVEMTPVGEEWKSLIAESPDKTDFSELIANPKFHVSIIRPEGTRYPLCFYETSRLLAWAFQDAGYDCTRRENYLSEDRINIVLGWHLWSKTHPLTALRRYPVILYQGEQLSPGGRQMPDWYVRSFDQAIAVWDYSPENIQMMQLHDMIAQHVPPMHHPKSEVIEYDHDSPKTCDVLFIGAMNPRREFIMRLLGQVCTAKAIFDVWGPERDEIIAESRIVLNVHYYQAETLELLRISHLVASGVPVISEEADTNPYGDGIESVPYNKILPTVLKYLANDELRKELGDRGRELFRQTDMVETVKTAIVAMQNDTVASIACREADINA